MKRILTLILVLALALTVLASCDQLSQIIPGLGGDETCTEHVDEDSNYVCDNCGAELEKPHDHNFVEGECACGEKDPDYVPEPEVDEDLQAAADYIRQMYKDDPKATSSDYSLIGSAFGYAITWTVDSEEIQVVVNEDGSVTIDVPNEEGEPYSDITYVLTATISNEDGDTLSKSFEHVVPKFKVNTWEEYMAAKEGDNLIVDGIVVAINSKSLGNTRNHLFLMDATGCGGYYSYQMDVDPVAELGIEVGMTVRVTGPAAPYDPMMEIKGGTAKIIDETIKKFDYIDITEKFVKDANFAEFVALPVVIKGVTLGGQELETASSQYLFFTVNGVESYVRTYVTDFPTTLKTEDKATIDALHAANYGNTADVYGIFIMYGKVPYIIPTAVDCFNNIQTPERTDAEKLELELGAINIASKFTSDTVIDLPVVGTTYDSVVISWTSDNDAIVIADGKATIVIPNDEVTVKLTATLTLGDATTTKEFEIKLSKSITSIVDAIAIGAAKDHNTYTEDKYMIAGIIKEVYNSTYGNLYLVDAYGNEITVYGTYSADGSARYDAMTDAPVAGDYVVILGVLGQYNGTAQMKNGWILSSNGSLSIPEASEMGAAKEHNTYTEEKYLVTGTVSEVSNTTYGNLYITDAEGNKIYIYGLYDETGKVRYDALTTAPAVGDTITVLSIVGQYNGTAQLKNAWLVSHTVASSEGEGEGEGEGETSGSTYVKITSADQFTSGKYVIVVENGYAPSYVDGTWILATQPVISDNTISGAADANWTITVNGSSATLADKNGVYIAPKGGNNNGIATGTAYNWAWTLNEDGTFTFTGTGADTVILAFNTDSQYLKFRGYKSSTVSSYPSSYPSNFTVYKLVEN
nr:hypothetical protein [Oscillospiraceae bacterium]